MSAFRLLALSYLTSASVFVVAATFVAHPEFGREFAGALARMALGTSQPQPVEPVARLELAPPPTDVVRHGAVLPPKATTVQANDDRLANSNPATSVIIPILPDLSPESAPVPAEPKLIAPDPIHPDVKLASSAPPALPRLEAPHLPPAQSRVAAARGRLKDKLTQEMTDHFGLILYISKARTGPLAQRMLVFENQKGALKPMHDWAVSTGREQDEISPRGRKSFTSTPKGFYAFDPDRMYRRYHSWSWDQDMPNAMFFNWERRGRMTGLAIHAAIGKDIAKLGSRASAGCVHLAPEQAALLYKQVREDYRGRVPRFAYSAETDTMSNSGNFMHDRKGRLRMVDGYRVLVIIDDYGGESRLADLD
jgi:lipoprotein-anchoring transpeptidase ErfK/SrfK